MPPRQSKTGQLQLTFEHIAVLLILGATLLFGWTLMKHQQRSIELNYTPRRQNMQRNRVLAAQAPELTLPSTGSTTIDDDPVLGDPNAPVTMVGFVDYECPFCRKFFLDILPQLEEKYVKTGKLKIVFRDLPIQFHEPVATLEAVAANCARQQGGDAGYFAFQKSIFSQTRSNGKGLNQGELEAIAAKLNLKPLRFQLCLDEPEVKAEIQRDVTAADTLGVIGTPSFVIGKTTDTGTVKGGLVLGVQTVTAFENEIERIQP